MTISKKRTLRDTVIIIVSSLLFGHLLFWLLPNVFETWNAQAFDQIFVLRYQYFPSRVPYDSTIIHVVETDSSVQVLSGGTYISRRQYGQIAHNIGEMQAAAQIWDYIQRAAQSAEEDSFFIACNKSAGNVYYGMSLDPRDKPLLKKQPRPASHWEYLSRTKWKVQVDGDISTMYVGGNPILTFPELASVCRGLGFINMNADRDGVFRRVPLLIRYDDAFYPSFPFRAICDYMHVKPEQIILRPGTSITLKGAYRLGQQPHDIVIPVDERCNIVVNFVGPWRRMVDFEMDRIYNVSEDRDAMEYDWKPLFKDKIVVVNINATGASDVQSVPTDPWYPLGGLHANVMNSILTENFLKEANTVEKIGLEILLLLIVGVLAIKFSSRGLWIGALVLLVGYIVFIIGIFLYGNLIINLVRPILIMVTAVFGVLVYRFINEEREKEATRRSFESYLPPSVVKRQLAHPESIFEVQKKELTIMFTDIKSFTTYSSIMSPDQIQNFLAEYFDAMVQIVFKYEGTVDKYIGDGLMVFFGAPEPQADHAVRCVKAAIEMQKKCRELKEKWVQEDLFPLKIRIGINTGEVVVGNMGTRKKLAYTVLGSDVNLANRLESNAPVEGIMISRRTYDLVKDEIPTFPHEPVLVKGLDTPIEVYIVPVDETTL
ncbi:MAG: adenylate/guanylate cyclase domain-containing protein [Bacteroidota bacterium]